MSKAKQPHTIVVTEAGEAGFDWLRDAADRELLQCGEEIAATLREKSKLGDTKSTKLLIELAKQQSRRKKVEGESVALMIASDEEWVETAERGATAAESKGAGAGK